MSGWRPPPGLRLVADGRVVVGGSPWRALVLGDPLADAARRTWEGEPDARVVEALVEDGLAAPLPPGPAGDGGLRLADVTLVVPVKDDAARLPRVLASVPAGVAVVVVDDGSSDGTADVARSLGAEVVRHDVARGPAAARNAGLRAATTSCVAFLDADVEAEPGWLAALLPHLGDACAVAPRVVALPDPAAGVLARYEAALSPLDKGAEPTLVGVSAAVDYVPSAALVVRRDVLLSCGGFDEQLRFGEDVDLCRRLVAAGHRVRYVPAVQVRHDHRTRLAPWLRRRAAYGSGAPAVAARHGTPQPPVPAPGALAAALVLVGPGPLRRRLLAAAAVGAAGAAATAVQAVAAGVPAREAVVGGARREAAGAQRVLGLLPRQGYLPLALASTVLSRRARRVVPAVVVLQHARAWRRGRPPVALPAYVGLRVLDEGAFGVGELIACLRARTLRPLAVPVGGPPAVRQAAPKARRTGMPFGDGS